MSTIKANEIIDAAGGNTATINGITPALASQAQATAGTDNTTQMTPLRTSQAITALTTAALVGAATAGLAAGDVGTYIFGYPNNTTNYVTGATIAGSLLLPAGSFTYDATSGNASSQSFGSAQSGTWRCMGNRVFAGSGQYTVTLWLRIS
jgi:hypothetical protein